MQDVRFSLNHKHHCDLTALNEKNEVIEFSLLLSFIYKAGTFWKPIRKLMNPSFNSKILQSFVPIFNDKTKSMLNKLDKEAGNRNFDILPFMNACTLDMVCGKLTKFPFHMITL